MRPARDSLTRVDARFMTNEARIKLWHLYPQISER